MHLNLLGAWSLFIAQGTAAEQRKNKSASKSLFRKSQEFAPKRTIITLMPAEEKNGSSKVMKKILHGTVYRHNVYVIYSSYITTFLYMFTI